MRKVHFQYLVYFTPWCTFWPGFKIIATLATKCATFQIFLNFDLCDLGKWVKTKTQTICHVLCLNVPAVKILWKSDKRFKRYCIFCVFTKSPLVAERSIGSDRNLAYGYWAPWYIIIPSHIILHQIIMKCATLTLKFWTLTSVTLKSRSNPKFGGYVVYHV